MSKTVLPYKLGEWSVFPKNGIARRQGENVHLEPRAEELLSYLASRAGEVVSREEILTAVWPGVVVGDEVITNAIAKLRKSLHDDPNSPTLIETVPKRGYRVIAPVSRISGRGSFARQPLMVWGLGVSLVVLVVVVLAYTQPWMPETVPFTESLSGLPLPDRPSVAVLPFTNLSNDIEQEYFTDGLTEDLITDLSRISGLFVIARNSSFAYKGQSPDPQMLRSELGVQFVISGSVRRVNSRIRVNVQLVDTDSGAEIWSQRFDGNEDDIFSIQDDMTENITTVLSVKISEIERAYADFRETLEYTAYEAFLKGWAHFQKETPEDFHQALTYFQAAVREDPGYGRAHAALAALYWGTYRKRWYRRLDISPGSRAWQLANEHLEKSMIAPTPLAHKTASAMLIVNRRFDEAVIEANRALALDPNDSSGYIALADAMIHAGAFEKAEELVARAIRLDPQGKTAYQFVLAKALLAKGDSPKAIALLEQVVRVQADDRLAWMALISASGLAGMQDKADAALEKLAELQLRDKLAPFTISAAQEDWPYKREVDAERFLQGLRLAGVSEW